MNIKLKNYDNIIILYIQFYCDNYFKGSLSNDFL